MNKAHLAKEIHNFRENQKTHIPLDMYILWEYKLTKTDYSAKALFEILKADKVHLKLDCSSDCLNTNISDLSQKQFYTLLEQNKSYNKKLHSFVIKMVK